MSVLDIGCGVGALTIDLVGPGRAVVGIDPSLRSIELARRKAVPGVSFENRSVEDYASLSPVRRFDAVVANMTLQCVVDLPKALGAASQLLKPTGTFVFTLPHPWFWPRYWEYEREPWFEYQAELFIEAPFRITHEASAVLSTHIHRPLGMYAAALRHAGLTLTDVAELPTLRGDLPRFLGGVTHVWNPDEQNSS
jgi:SAM-dependent methyltransferase